MLRSTTLWASKCLSCQYFNIFIRNMTTTEVATALRPFYFSVHPDLFGQHPEERATNEQSLQQLSSTLQNLQTSKFYKPITLKFYIKSKDNRHKVFKQIKIYIKEKDIQSAVLNILKSCELPTDYVDKITNTAKPQEQRQFVEDIFNTVRVRTNDIDFTDKINRDHPIYATFAMQQKIRENRDAQKLKNWLKKNYELALKQHQEGQASREEIDKLKNTLTQKLGLKDIFWDCGWNNQHFRACLLALQSLLEHHPENMSVLKDRILVFSYFTGISSDGHVRLFSGEVRHNWLDFIKKIKKHDATLKRLPIYEKTLSHVLKSIKVGRRKFMLKVVVEEYEKNLRQITTSLNDFLCHNAFPKTWPTTLEDYEIVVESEAGPMMVSPTGQFIVPSSIPGSLLVNFITNNLIEAGTKMADYSRNKHIEKSLKKHCFDQLGPIGLTKDDNITPDFMIKCCERLLDHKNEISLYTKGLNLKITTFYSLLSDGVVCIPWNFEL